MKYQVTDIEFDFSDNYYEETAPVKYQEELYDQIIGSFWDADDGDDLVDEITSSTGWLIKSIDYRIVLK
jgi:hypothetical protein